MKKILIASVIIFIIASSCTSVKKVMDSWMGATKQQLILRWGPPTTTASDGNGGEILIYARRVYGQFNYTTVDYWEYKMMYFNQQGKAYHWIVQNNPNPPQRIDVRLLIQ